MSEQIDISNQNLDCGCLFCGRRFDVSYGRAAETNTVTCPACGETIEVGDRLREIRQQISQMTGCDIREKP